MIWILSIFIHIFSISLNLYLFVFLDVSNPHCDALIAWPKLCQNLFFAHVEHNFCQHLFFFDWLHYLHFIIASWKFVKKGNWYFGRGVESGLICAVIIEQLWRKEGLCWSKRLLLNCTSCLLGSPSSSYKSYVGHWGIWEHL